MNRTELIHSVSEACALTTSEVTALLDSMIYTITVALRDGEAVRIGGFGTFKPRERPARWGRDAQTGAAVRIKASIGIGFVAGAGLKKYLNSRGPVSSTSRLASGRAGAAEVAPTKKAPNRKARSGQRARRAKETIGRSAMSIHHRTTNQDRWRTATRAITLEEYKRKGKPKGKRS